MKPLFTYPVFLFITLLLAGCHSTYLRPVQDGEIVYQTGSIYQNEIGFIDTGGFNSVLKTTTYLRKPVWSLNGSIIFYLGDPSPANTLGYPGYWNQTSGKLKVCSHNLPYYGQIEGAGNKANFAEVLLASSRTIVLYDLEKCRLIKVLVDYSNHGELILKGFSFYPDYQELLYGMVTNAAYHQQEFRIMKMGLKTGESVELAKGVNPSWSPDGSQIAYVGEDGIYLMKADGSQPKSLIKHQFLDPSENGTGEVAPMPRWSSDSEWIVYHRCSGYECSIDENTIYKIEAIGGEEVTIIDRGAFPSWKP
jgi:Tol biopolymer transport system component